MKTKYEIESTLSSSKHPCYNDHAHQYARMHIPVAPKCNIQCNYCNRKYDCMNESRPGVSSEILTPMEALEKFKYVKEKVDNLTVVGIAGPGDALANFNQTKESIRLIKEYDPHIMFCLSTNGLSLPQYAEELIDMDVRHVTITINAIDAAIGAKIYKYVQDGDKKITGKEAAELLIGRQLEGLDYLSSKGVLCKVNTVMIKGINDYHIEDVVKRVKKIGAHMTNIMPLVPIKGTLFENVEKISVNDLKSKRDQCGIHLKQMYHCQQCRSDAIGRLSHDQSSEFAHYSCHTREIVKDIVDHLKNLKRNGEVKHAQA